MLLNDLEYDATSQQNPVFLLRRLLEQSGSCVMNGYLGEHISRCYFDEDGLLEYITDCKKKDTDVHSQGVVLSNSVLVKQIQKNRDFTTNHLYSWDLDQGIYTFLSFDNTSELNRYFNTIKRFDANLCEEDISTQFQEMGLSFDSIQRILLNQSVNPLSRMFDDEFSKDEKESSFVL